jgi:hypothetical protein
VIAGLLVSLEQISVDLSLDDLGILTIEEGIEGVVCNSDSIRVCPLSGKLALFYSFDRMGESSV